MKVFFWEGGGGQLDNQCVASFGHRVCGLFSFEMFRSRGDIGSGWTLRPSPKTSCKKRLISVEPRP